MQYTQAQGREGNSRNKVATPAQVIQMVMEEAHKRGYDWFQPFHAAGIVGNLMQESGHFRQDVVNFNYRGDNGTAHGIMQWRGGRFANLLDFARQNDITPQDIRTQISFMFEEMIPKNGYTDAGSVTALNSLKNAKNAQEAAIAFIHAERPQGYKSSNPALSHGSTNRINFATQSLMDFGDGSNIAEYNSSNYQNSWEQDSSSNARMSSSNQGGNNTKQTNALNSYNAPMSQMMVNKLKSSGFTVPEFSMGNFGAGSSTSTQQNTTQPSMYQNANTSQQTPQFTQGFEKDGEYYHFGIEDIGQNQQQPIATNQTNLQFPVNNNLTFGIDYDNMMNRNKPTNNLTFGF